MKFESRGGIGPMNECKKCEGAGEISTMDPVLFRVKLIDCPECKATVRVDAWADFELEMQE